MSLVAGFAILLFAALPSASCRASLAAGHGNGAGLQAIDCSAVSEHSDELIVDDWSVNLLQITLDRQAVSALATPTAAPPVLPTDVVAASEEAEDSSAADAFLLVMLGIAIGGVITLIAKEVVAITNAKDSPVWHRRLSFGADIPEDFDPGESWAALGTLTSSVVRRKKLVIRCWVFAAIVGAVAITQMSVIMSNTLSPSKGMVSYEHDKLFEARFPGRARGASYALVIEGEEGRRILDTPNFDAFSKELRDELNESGQLIEYDSNTTFWEENRIPAQSMFVSENKQATFITWSINASVDSDEAFAFGMTSRPIVDKKIKMLSGITYHGITGLTYAVAEAVIDMERVLITVDCIVTPVVIGVLWWMLGTWRLLIVPGSTLVVSTLVTAGMISTSSIFVAIHIAAPSLMMCILVAMGMDYSLFILTRFKEELRAARKSLEQDPAAARTPTSRRPKVDMESVISKTMQTAGFMVLASGCLLLITISMLTLFPISFIRSIGVAAFFALGNTMLVNLTLPPAILASYPDFFSAIEDDVEPTEDDGDGLAPPSRRRSLSGKGLLATAASAKSTLENALKTSKPGRVYSAAWIRVAQTVTTWPGNALAIAASVVLVVCVGSYAVDLQTSNDLTMLIPRGTQAGDAYTRLRFHFGAGTVAPYMVMMEPVGGGTIMDEDFWHASQKVLHSYANEIPATDPDSFIFPSFAAGREVPWLLVRTCEGLFGGTDRSACKYPHFLLEHFANPERTAMWGYIRTGFDPFSHQGVEWLKKIRQLSEDHLVKSGVKIVIAGVGTNYNDVSIALDSAFPYIASANLLAVMIASGFVFHSVFVPMVQILSIVFTLTVCYGITVLVYQLGALEWTGLGCVAANGGIPSMGPVISFPFTVGLCLDYDVFLLTRIREFRTFQMPANKAIQHALCSTGSIISVAGFIMAFTFAGLLVSGMGIINVNALILFVAIFYDAFFVRTMLMPAVQSALGARIWWPSDLSIAHQPAINGKLGGPQPVKANAAAATAASVAAPLPRVGRSRSPSARKASGSRGSASAAKDTGPGGRDPVRRSWLGCCRRRERTSAPASRFFPEPGADGRSLQLVDADWQCIENVSSSTIQDLVRMVAEVENGQWGSPVEDSPPDYDLYVQDDPKCPVSTYAALVVVDRNEASLQEIMDASPYSCIATHLSNSSEPCSFTPLFERTAETLSAPPGRGKPAIHVDQLNVFRRAFGFENGRTNHHIACDYAECTDDDGSTCYAWTFVGVYSPAVETSLQSRPQLRRKLREKAESVAGPDDGVLVNHIVGVVVREVDDEWQIGVVMKVDPGLPFFAPRWAAEQALRAMIEDCTNGVLKDLLGDRSI